MVNGREDDYQIEGIKLRAVEQTEVHNEDTGEIEDLAIWFAAVYDDDEWFAHGISNIITDDVAIAIHDTIDRTALRVMLALSGQPWEIIKPYPVQHAVSQRNLLHQMLDDKKQWKKLCSFSRSQLRELRARNERDNFDPRMN